MIRSVSSGIKLDSMKLKFPTDSLKSIGKDSFQIGHPLYKLGEEPPSILKLNKKAQTGESIIGLKAIEIGESESIIEISGKILRENYYQLISLQTIGEVIQRINGTGFIELDPVAFLDTAEVLRCDSTSDIQVAGDIGDYLQSLKVYGSLNTKYEATPYKRTGFVFKKKVSSYKERLLIYDKYTEVMRDKNRVFLQPEMFLSTMRFESNHTDLKHIRKRFNVDTKQVLLMDVLKSKEQVNLNLFTSIVDSPDIAEAKARFDALRFDSIGQPLNRIEQRKGRQGIIRDCNLDMNLVRLYLRDRVKGNISRYVREYADVLADMVATGGESEIDRALPFDTNHISEIRELLKVA